MDNPQPNSETRSSLIQRVTQLDPDGWIEFVELYDPLLLAYIGELNRLLHYDLDAHGREDVKQEVLIKLCSKLSSFVPSLRFRTWLWAVTRNVFVDWVRRERGRRKPTKRQDGPADSIRRPTPEVANVQPRNIPLTPQMEESLVSDESEPDEQLIREHDRHMLRFVFRKVKEERKSAVKWLCFEMRYLQGLSSREVAEKFGISIGLVDVNVFRVLARIREVCQEYDVDL